MIVAAESAGVVVHDVVRRVGGAEIWSFTATCGRTDEGRSWR